MNDTFSVLIPDGRPDPDVTDDLKAYLEDPINNASPVGGSTDVIQFDVPGLSG